MRIKIILFQAALLLCALSASNAFAGGFCGSYTQYTESSSRYTRAPWGYKPFYISHYARHGSRYLISENELAAVAIMDARREGLTSEGKALLEDLTAVAAAHEGMMEMLTGKGGTQHQGIGRRMAKHFRRVFRRRGREIRCISSPSQRCIQSMANCIWGLRDGGAKGQVSTASGRKYYDVISPRFTPGPWLKTVSEKRDSLMAARGVPDSVAVKFFLPSAAPSGDEMMWLCNSLYRMAAASQGLDAEFPDILGRHFGESVSGAMQEAEILYNHTLFCDDEAEGNLWMEVTSRAVLKEILAKADDALDRGTVAADLRFGHDSGLMPLMKLMGFGVMDLQMAANLQIVFYRNCRGRVLIKFLYDEKEMKHLVLKAVRGCYYDWKETKAYLNGQI